MSRRVRTTISLPEDVLAVYREMADRSGVSLSRCIGDWLDSTADSAQLINQKIIETRGLPSRFLASMTSLIDGAEDAIGAVAVGMQSRPSAPSSNTGLKSLRKGAGDER